MKQIIIARKDLKMSPGKLATQVAHASMAFLTSKLKNTEGLWELSYHTMGYRENAVSSAVKLPKDKTEDYRWGWRLAILLDEETYADWVWNTPMKIVCQAKNKNKLFKAIEKAKELGLEENKDYFLIKDTCLTELTPEEIDEDGVGRTLTCIGFRPLPDEIANQLSYMYHLYV